MKWDSPKDKLVPTWFLAFFLIISLGVIYLGFERVFSSVALNPAPATNQQNNNINFSTNPVNIGVLPQLQGDNTITNSSVPAGNPVNNSASTQNQNTVVAPTDTSIDPKMLRAFLEQGGIPKTDLDKLDDAALMQAYNKTLQDIMSAQNK